MKLKNQCCSLEQGKRFKELELTGSLFHHFQGRIASEAWGNDYYPAFTAAELGIMANSEYYTMRDGSETSEYANWSWYSDANNVGMGPFNTQAEAAADLIIWLLENGHATAEECNNRLKE